MPTSARARRSGSITAYLQESLSGIRVVRSFAQEPRHLREFAALNDSNRDANYVDGEAQRRVLPGGRVRVVAGDGAGPADRRHAGDQRPRLGRRARRLHRSAERLLRPDRAALAALHDLPVGHGGAGQDLRAARRGAGPRRALRPGRAAAAPARRDHVRRRHVRLRGEAGAVATCRSSCHPARRSPWSARRARASRRSPSSSRASTTRRPAAS